MAPAPHGDPHDLLIAGRAKPVATVTLASMNPSTESGDAPLAVSFTFDIRSDGSLGQFQAAIDCTNDSVAELTSDLSYGETISPFLTRYTMEGFCSYPADGSFTARGVVYFRDGEEIGTHSVSITVGSPAETFVNDLALDIGTGIEPVDPTITATCVGNSGAVTWGISCNGDDGVYEVTSADTDTSLSSTECSAFTDAGTVPVTKTICVRATRSAVPSDKSCAQFTLTPQAISWAVLVPDPDQGPEPLENVNMIAAWVTNGGNVDLQIKADAAAACPASPGDDDDCFQVENVAGPIYNMETDGSATFDYASDGTYTPVVTVSDTDGAAPAVTDSASVVVTAVADPDPVFGIAFVPVTNSCQLDSSGECSIEMAPVCTGDALGPITAGTLDCGSGGTAHVGSVEPASAIGANLNNWSNFDTSIPYCNRMKAAGYDTSTGGWGAQLGATGITHNSDGYPTGWTDGDGGAAAYVRTFINREMDRVDPPDVTTNAAHYPEGTYELTCTGDATLDLAGDASGADCSCPDTCSYTVANATETGIEVIARTPFTSGTPNIVITGPDACTGNWRNDWLAALAPASVIRTMDWSRASYTPPATWATRTPVTRYAYSNATNTTVATVPLEVQIDAANTARKDLWLNIPDAATDEVIEETAALVASTLSPDLKVYPELGNEIWNTASVFADAHNRADAAGVGLCTAPCDEWFYFQMKRQMEVWGVFEGELGDERVINVLALQNAAPERSGSTYMAYDPGGTLAPSGTVGANVEAIAVAPYFDMICPDGSQCSLNSLSGGYDGAALRVATPATWHEYMLASINTTASDQQPARLEQHVANCALLPDCRVVGYEGGSHVTLSGGAAEADTTLVAAFWAAHTDQGMQGVMEAYLDRWREITGGGLMNLYQFPIARGTKFNYWGHGEFYDTYATAPKYIGAVSAAGTACVGSVDEPSTCTWTTSGSKTTSDSGWTREGIADSDASTTAVTVVAAPVAADLEASCNALAFTAGKGVGAPAPACVTCTVRNITSGTLTSTNTLTMTPSDWGATRTPASQTTTTEIDTVSVCVPDPDILNVGTYQGSLRIENNSNAGDASTFPVTYNVTSPPQTGDPTWWAGRNGSNQPLVSRGDGRGTVAMVNVSNRATPTMANQLGRGMVQYDADFSNANTEYSMIYNTTFDRQNGVVNAVGDTSTDCIPYSECNTNPFWVSNEDVVHLPWNSYRSNSTLVAANTFKRAYFYQFDGDRFTNPSAPQMCNSNAGCPHVDIIQGDMVNQCPINPANNGTFAFIGNRIGLSDDQDIHWTRWRCGGQRMIVLIQGNRLISDAGFDYGCARRGTHASNNRDCNKTHFNVPNDGGNQGTPHYIWCIDNDFPIKGGSGTGSNSVTSATRIVKVGQCTTNFAGSPGNGPVSVTYASVEVAITAEKALGNPIPDFIEVSNAGRATPITGAINAPGDPD